ncbi:MAG: hypothetical protein QNJ45_17940 [Ardenticatenaceae bacterium]|nr:hypothetical protein [Ardenticatenaceae bacterium]
MSLFGTIFTLLVGPTVPLPAPPNLLETLDRVEVTHSDEGRSGFQMVFKIGRTQTDFLDYQALSLPLLRPFSRVVMMVTFNAIPQVLFDGVITNQQLSPGQEAGQTRLTVTGEDVSVMMDLKEVSVEHPAQPELVIALKIIATYAQYGLIPTVIPPPTIDVPLPIDRTPVQQGTDLAYLREMAERHAYTFYVEPGPAPLVNKAYWGPRIRVGVPQRALTAGMGSANNIIDINFQNNGLGPQQVSGQIQDRTTNVALPVQTFASTRIPLVTQPAWLTQPHTRQRAFRTSSATTVQAFSQAQAEMDRSQDNVVTGSGTLDALRYEALLKPRGLVGLRGVGYSFDGLYYVKQVNHTIEQGSYQQRFSLEREGLGSITPVVIP